MAPQLGIDPAIGKKLGAKGIQNLVNLQAAQQRSMRVGLSGISPAEQSELLETMPEQWRSAYAAATTGGKTKIMERWVDHLERTGFELPSGRPQTPASQMPQVPQSVTLRQPETVETEGAEIVSPEGEAIIEQEELLPGVQRLPKHDFDRGLTQKERVQRQADRYKTQFKPYEELAAQVHSLEEEKLTLDRLEGLNDQVELKEGLQFFNVNPQTGEFVIPAFATPEEQLYMKTVNNFIRKAKDSFGARVTNFDLEVFKSGLPLLSNSKEGRALILRQMQIVNELSDLHDRTKKSIIDDYGIRNIDFSESDRLTQEAIKEPRDSLVKRYKNLDGLLEAKRKETVKEAKTEAPEGKIAMQSEDGRIAYITPQDVAKAEKRGFKRL